jgi:NADP-dependent 3-hydroxy acid dehydrogenase YdfG
MSRFDGKIVVITGGKQWHRSRRRTAVQGRGATVIVTGRYAATLEAAAKSLGNQALTVKTDVTKTKYGRIDVLFVNAGGAKVAFGSGYD